MATAFSERPAVQWLVNQGARTDITPLNQPLPELGDYFPDKDQCKKDEVSNFLKSPGMKLFI